GKEYQDELNLNFYDYGARNYDPAIGRWMNVDPLAEQAPDWTPYRYGFNNPIRYTDPTGMFECDGLDWIPGTDGNKIDFEIDDKTKEVIWTDNTPEKFKSVANELLKTKIGENVLREAIDSPIKMNVEFIEDSDIVDGNATFGKNKVIKLSSDGKSIL